MKHLLDFSSAAALDAHLRHHIPPVMTDAHVPGAAVAVVRDGTLFCDLCFGLRIAGTGVPVTPGTLFEAGSLSKPVFAYAALALHEQGDLDLDRPLDDYLPAPYLPGDPHAAAITARHVLSHTPGFPNWRPDGEPLCTHLPPGSRFSYSGEGYVYLATAVEHILDASPHDYVQAHLLDPLGMSHTRWLWTGEETLPAAHPHSAAGEPEDKRLWPEFNPAASLHSTAADLTRFLLAMLHPDPTNPAHRRSGTISHMLTWQTPVNDQAPWHDDWPRPHVAPNDRVGWGLGWGLQRASWGNSFWHWGDTGSQRAFAVGWPEAGAGIVLLTNGRNGQQVIDAVLRQAIGGDYPALDWLADIYRDA